MTVLFYILAESPMFRKDRSPRSPLMEKQLFAIDKLCRKSMPERYKQDTALLILFYTFALIEDTYRPSGSLTPSESRTYAYLSIRYPPTSFAKNTRHFGGSTIQPCLDRCSSTFAI